MRRSKDELVKKFSEIVGDNNADDVLGFMEDLADSLEDTDKDEIEAWKRKYEENDSDWRRRYRERFMGNRDPNEGEGEVHTEPDDKDEERYGDREAEDKSIRDLFTAK